ncbi:putative monooxygenase [Mycobacterium xenopi 3993]|nr:putative monooxygenase [Mycobacterium xenopi 3993]
MVFMIESQIHYVAEAIATCDRLGAQALAPTRAAQDGSTPNCRAS